jgi:hypothetical protein
MNIIEKVKEFLDSLDAKKFYTYIGAFFGIITLVLIFLVYRFYANVWDYQRQIRLTNDMRIEVQALIEKAARVKKQQKDVNEMLEADPNFKIAGYFQTVLAQLGLSNKEESNTVTTQERGEQEYNESILTAKFIDMTMQEVSELLNVLEQNKRIYTKSLELQKSRKSNRTIEVQLTIATLQPRT